MKHIAKFPLKNDISLKGIVVLKQNISLVSKTIFSAPILFILLFLIEINSWNLFLGIIFIPIFGFKYEYVVKDDAQCYALCKLFNLIIYTYAKNCIKPKYIALTNQSYKEGASWMWFPFFSSTPRFKLYTIKFFNGSNRETVFKTANKEEAVLKATELSKFLNVKIHNTLKS